LVSRLGAFELNNGDDTDAELDTVELGSWVPAVKEGVSTISIGIRLRGGAEPDDGTAAATAELADLFELCKKKKKNRPLICNQIRAREFTIAVVFPLS
jgi:hypothetical protein